VRPVSITIEGLRSFRSPKTIDFTGRDYFAVIGDTGAGKSSILEALTFALYGRTTFSGRGLQELVNASATRLRVALTFEVNGDRWEVARTMRRDGKGSVQTGQTSLRHLGEDGVPIESHEQTRVVNEKVESLLGLDAEAFLRTVVLPQGQFSRLLVEDKAGERANVLRQIWRTDELTEAGRHADQAFAELGPLIGRLQQALVNEPEDVDGHLASLTASAEEAAAVLAGCRNRHSSLEEAARSRAAAEARASQFRQMEAAISRWDGTGARSAADELAVADAEATAAAAAIDGAIDATRASLASIPPDDADGLTPSAVASCRTTLASLPERDAQRRQAVDQVAHAEAQLAELASAVVVATQTKATADIAEQTARDRRDLAATEAERARSRLQQVQGAIAEARRLKSTSELADAAHETSEGAIDQANTALEAANSARAAAEQAYEDAATALRTAQRTSLAAEAGHGLHAGEPCPVCDQELPSQWKPAKAPGLEKAESVLAAAAKAWDSKRTKSATLEERHEAAVRTAAGAQTAKDEGQAAALASLEVLGELLGTEPDLTLGDEILLAAEIEAVDTAASASASASRAHSGLEEALTAADYELIRLQAEHAAGKKSLERAIQGSASADDAYAKEVERLPEDLRPGTGDIEADTARLDALLVQRLDVLTERADQRIAWQKKIDDQVALRGDTETQRQVKVLAPADRLWTDLVTHQAALGPAAAAVASDAASEPLPERPSVAGLTDRVRQLQTATDEVGSALAAAVADSEMEKTAADEAISTIAEALNLTDATFASTLDAASKLLENSAFEHRQAAAAANAFRERMPAVAELRAAASDLEDRYLALADLAAALKDGAFPKWLTLRRSKLLLVHASRLLSEMSGQRYAFADLDDDAGQWSVFDNDNGQPRSPASLSGGEKFVASLALALGMVEMMGRQGGRIESLFLDEGFGALDRTNLDAAVEALASVAAKGRMVGVVTHLRAVAEQIDNVLSVTREPAGSEAVWLADNDRADLAASSIETASGLLE
jgi:exonuclease SbcC